MLSARKTFVVNTIKEVHQLAAELMISSVEALKQIQD